MKNPYRPFVSAYARLLRKGGALPQGGLPPARAPRPRRQAPKILLFSPHPDDECLTGALPLRLRREARWAVLNVAVTQGSRPDRQAARLAELQGACAFLGFGVRQTAPNGLERINLKARAQDPAHWAACVEAIAQLLAAEQPQAVLVPHEHDWNSTHIGTHVLVLDALRRLGPEWACLLIESEYWQPMAAPNLMVETGLRDTAELVAATSFHVGEVARNPYHVRLPAWMQDNVRRGGELVGGQGGAAPDFAFATLYRVRAWRQGQPAERFAGGRIVSAADAVEAALMT